MDYDEQPYDGRAFLICPVCDHQMVKAKLRGPGAMNIIYVDMPSDGEENNDDEKEEVEISTTGLDAWVCRHCGRIVLHTYTMPEEPEEDE